MENSSKPLDGKSQEDSTRSDDASSVLQVSKKQIRTIVVIDNFYKNPMEVREFALNQTFDVVGNFPGRRTRSFASQTLREEIQSHINEKITRFHLADVYTFNGAFQYTTSRDRSWIHHDVDRWAGVLYLTPDAPFSAGTGLFAFNDDKSRNTFDVDQTAEKKFKTNRYSQDKTRWTLVDQIGNVFNRLVLFNSHHFHESLDYFGSCKEDGRLFQVFFFDTDGVVS
jgi:hypothetical protein